MSLAALDPTGGVMPTPNGLQSLFWHRLYIGLYGNDAAYDAWAATATAADDAWFAARYSGYVMFFIY